jgi:hypothetical protein
MKTSSPILEFFHTLHGEGTDVISSSFHREHAKEKNLSFKTSPVQPHSRIVTSNRCTGSVAFEVTYFFGRLSEAPEIQDRTNHQRGPCCEV